MPTVAAGVDCTVASGPELVDDLLGAFATAATRQTETATDLAVAGRRVRVRVVGEALGPALTSALAHRRLESGTAPDLTIHAWDESASRTAPPGECLALARRAQTGSPPRRTDVLVHTAGADGLERRSIQALDRVRGLAVMCVPDARTLGTADCCRPMLRLLHWWLADQPWQVVHGAAVGPATGGVLLAGLGGAGKSTTALACVEAGWRYGGDDYVLVRAHPAPAIANLYASARLRLDMIRHFGWLESAPAAPGVEAPHKRSYVLSGRMPAATLTDFPLTAILLPRVGRGGAHTLRPATRAEASLALAATLTTLQGTEESALAKIGALVGAVPAYRLELGPDVLALPAFIAGALDLGRP